MSQRLTITTNKRKNKNKTRPCLVQTIRLYCSQHSKPNKTNPASLNTQTHTRATDCYQPPSRFSIIITPHPILMPKPPFHHLSRKKKAEPTASRVEGPNEPSHRSREPSRGNECQSTGTPPHPKSHHNKAFVFFPDIEKEKRQGQ